MSDRARVEPLLIASGEVDCFIPIMDSARRPLADVGDASTGSDDPRRRSVEASTDRHGGGA